MDKSQEESKLLPRNSASPGVVLDEAESGEEWDAEEPFACPRLEDEEIPAGDEETKVVLLPVNPHLVYVYWEFSAWDLEAVNRVFSRLGPRARPVLRFYETKEANSESLNSASWFEVAIALSAGKWYVRLDHPANSYCLDLGLCLGGGSLRWLARSNVAEMPKACPSDKTEERYFRANGNHPPAEVVVTPAAGKSALPSAPPVEKRQAPPGRLLESRDALRTLPAGAEPPGWEVNWPEHCGASPPVPASAVHSGDEGNLAAPPSESHSHPADQELQGGGGIAPQLDAARLSRAATAGDVDRQIEELCLQRSWDSPWWSPAAEEKEESQAAAKVRADLTEVSERSFRAGLSSGQKTP